MLGLMKNPCRSKVMAFSNKCLLLLSWERGFSMGSRIIECSWAINATRVFDDLWWVNAFTDDNIIFASVMASNTVNGL